MSRNDSSPAGGFTVLEALVAFAVFGVLIAALFAFFRNARHSYNLQEEITERDQNAHFVLKRLSEILMQAGANLPGQGWPVISPPQPVSDRFHISTNPAAGVQFVKSPVPFGAKVPVDDEKGFRRAYGILVEYKNKSKGIQAHPLNPAYNGNGFVNGVKAVDTGPDTLYLSGSIQLVPGDVVHAHARDEYRIQNQELFRGSMVLAQGIDSLTVTFLTQAKAPTQFWAEMKSARISVVARTNSRDPDLAGDGYRRVTLSTYVLLRNRL